MKRLPLAYDCPLRFADMEGGTVRHCQECDRDVVDLSSLDEASARTLLSERTVQACVRYRVVGGRIAFARTRQILAVAAAAAVLLAAAPSHADNTTPPPKEAPPAPTKKRAAKKPKKHEHSDDKMGLLDRFQD
jgi:hypothetical protein